MTTFVFLAGAILGAIAGWWLATQRAAGQLSAARAEMRGQVRQWQEAAARAQAEVARLGREAQTWAAGCKQGREDVISIVPLLVAAQQRPANSPEATTDAHDCGSPA